MQLLSVSQQAAMQLLGCEWLLRGYLLVYNPPKKGGISRIYIQFQQFYIIIQAKIVSMIIWKTNSSPCLNVSSLCLEHKSCGLLSMSNSNSEACRAALKCSKPTNLNLTKSYFIIFLNIIFNINVLAASHLISLF